MGYGPWVRKESDKTELTQACTEYDATYFHTLIFDINFSNS